MSTIYMLYLCIKYSIHVISKWVHANTKVIVTILLKKSRKIYNLLCNKKDQKPSVLQKYIQTCMDIEVKITMKRTWKWALNLHYKKINYVSTGMKMFWDIRKWKAYIYEHFVSLSQLSRRGILSKGCAIFVFAERA